MRRHAMYWAPVLIVLALGCGRRKWPPGELVRLTGVDHVTIHWQGGPKSVHMVGVKSPPMPMAKPTDDARSVRPISEPHRNLLRKTVAFMKSSLDGKPIHFGSPDGGLRDDHGALRVYIETDGKDLGAELLKRGMAVVRESDDHSRKDEYRELESRAKQAKRGWWGIPAQEIPKEAMGDTKLDVGHEGHKH